LIGVWVIVAVQTNVDVADDEDRFLVDGNAIQNGGQFVVE